MMWTGKIRPSSNVRPYGHGAIVLFFALLISSAIVFLLAGCSPSTENSSGFEQGETASDSIPAERIPGIPAEKVSVQSDETDSPAQESIAPDTTTIPTGDTILVRFLDVGQGDAILISNEGHHMLIDGGPPSSSSTIYSILKQLGLTKLDVVVATHPDADHCGGIAGALNYAECTTFYCPVTTYETRAFENILSHLVNPIVVPSYGDTFSLGSAEIKFVNPMSSDEPRGNDGSLVCLLTYGQTKFLFTGDAETASESAMLNGDFNLNADVLKVGHHGSPTSSSPAFLKTVNPNYAVVSVGDNNYGHPAPSTIHQLEAQGIEVLRTDELGTITFVSDGTNIRYTASTGNVNE